MNCLDVKNVSINFGGIKALDKVTFEVAPGQIYSIIGPNGAGKSTIFNCVTGFYKATEGQIFFQGKEITSRKPHLIQRYGIARTFQNGGLFNRMSVAENILVAKHHDLRGGIFQGAIMSPRVREEERKALGNVRKILESLKLIEVRNRLVSELPTGYQKLTELGRALALNPLLLLIDEPASGMNPQEKEFLAQVICSLKRKTKITVILIEHDMQLVMKISDQICVLNYGKKIAEGSPEAIKDNPRVLEAYLGRKKKAIKD